MQNMWIKGRKMAASIDRCVGRYGIRTNTTFNFLERRKKKHRDSGKNGRYNVAKGGIAKGYA